MGATRVVFLCLLCLLFLCTHGVQAKKTRGPRKGKKARKKKKKRNKPAGSVYDGGLLLPEADITSWSKMPTLSAEEFTPWEDARPQVLALLQAHETKEGMEVMARAVQLYHEADAKKSLPDNRGKVAHLQKLTKAVHLLEAWLEKLDLSARTEAQGGGVERKEIGCVGEADQVVQRAGSVEIAGYTVWNMFKVDQDKRCTRVASPSVRVVWQQEVLMASSQAAAIRQAIGYSFQNSLAGDQHLSLSLRHQLFVFQHSPPLSPQRRMVLETASQVFIGMRLFCEGVSLLQTWASLQGSLSVAVRELTDLSREQFILASHNCNPQLTVDLFDVLLAEGYLQPSDPTRWCLRCWSIHDLALRALGRLDESTKFFHDRLVNYVPWTHASQTSTTFNKFLITPEEQPWHDPKDHRVGRLLLERGPEIVSEFESYQRSVLSGDQADSFLGNHPDAYLAVADGGGWWEYLYLKIANTASWDADLCRKHFPRTCEMLRDLPEIDNGLVMTGATRCDGYCPGHYSSPGGIAFLRLGGGRTVVPHSGPTNQRLKCHIVIYGPPKDSDGAQLTVAGVTKFVGPGEVYCFDDSYVHHAVNGGGEFHNASRVVLDVPLWHPKLVDAYSH